MVSTPAIGNILNYLVIINAACNFILYCALSAKYRETVKDIIFRRGQLNRQVSQRRRRRMSKRMFVKRREHFEMAIKWLTHFFSSGCPQFLSLGLSLLLFSSRSLLDTNVYIPSFTRPFTFFHRIFPSILSLEYPTHKGIPIRVPG